MRGLDKTSRALVVGLGASGRAAAALLRAIGVDLVGYDRRPPEDLDFPVHSVVSAQLLSDVELVVLSPGVDPRPIREHASPDQRIVGEMGLALEYAPQVWGHLPTALVTGTNGKSTVTAMVGHILAAAALEPFCGGNLGEPLSARIAAVLRGEASPPGALALECSSYQLETMTGSEADAVAILNLSPDHLDRYPSFEDYARTKLRVFEDCQGPCLAWARDPTLRDLLARAEHACPNLNWIDDEDEPVLSARGLRLAGAWVERASLHLSGTHNARNAAFAAALVAALGVDDGTIAEAISSFRGLPHRMVEVRTVDEVVYFNDSKATNVASVVASLDGFPRPYVLIAGGKPKGDELAPLATMLAANGRALVAIGEAAPRLMALDLQVPCVLAKDMADAVDKARALAQSGDAVVLSPACASFDMYDNYAVRGQAFTAAVAALAPAKPISP